jgi:ornithine carbamoyltransferase
VLQETERWKRARGQGEAPRPLAGKSVALIFDKPSTRTRLSLEIAVVELGGHPVVVNAQSSQMGRGEPIRDTARVMSRMVDAITFRTSSHQRVQEMAEHSSVPVLNALTDHCHPMQVLSDLATVRQVLGTHEGLRYAWLGDGSNVCHSWIRAAGLLGLELVIGCPEGFEPDRALVDAANARGGWVRVLRDPREAVRDAHVINTDVFISMGQEAEKERRLVAFQGFGLTSELVALARSNVMVLHCLPAHRGEEIDDDVIEGPHSYVWDQAEGRLHSGKAALLWVLGEDG